MIDPSVTARVARLARLSVPEDEMITVTGELQTILAFVEQLNAVDVTGVAPVSNVHDAALRARPDAITDGFKAQDILADAPQKAADFFVVGKVVE